MVKVEVAFTEYYSGEGLYHSLQILMPNSNIKFNGNAYLQMLFLGVMGIFVMISYFVFHIMVTFYKNQHMLNTKTGALHGIMVYNFSDVTSL